MNSMNSPEYFSLTEEYIAAAAQIFTRAFQHDPLFIYLLPKQKSRKNAMQILLRAVVTVKVKCGEIYGIGVPLQGVATWNTPLRKKKNKKKKNDTFWALLQSGFGRMLFSAFVWGMFKGIHLAWTTNRNHSKYAPGRHFYLEMLAVDPSSHGRGLSSKLIKPMLHLAHVKNLPVYLETSNLPNVALYEHFGFTVVEKMVFGHQKMKIWAFLKKN
ncbi:MAG: N-acetyltransferase [Promethearchaeota archaeon]|nr:MAG: N-acetyltransferase [Candidatus Lokiarchaeota archaeon]